MILTIDAIPKGPNGPKGLLRMHWAARKRYSTDWYYLVMAACAGRFNQVGPLASRVHIHQTRKRLMDEDNLAASCKPILDAIVKLGLIFDDSPKYCSLRATQEKGKQTQTIITIEE